MIMRSSTVAKPRHEPVHASRFHLPSAATPHNAELRIIPPMATRRNSRSTSLLSIGKRPSARNNWNAAQCPRK